MSVRGILELPPFKRTASLVFLAPGFCLRLVVVHATLYASSLLFAI